MSKLVDERVVELKFDNRDFERNTRQSMSTLQKLKSSLNFSGVSSSVNNSVKSVSFDPISKGLETAGKSFSAFDAIAFSVINNITNRVVDLGIQMVKSLSVDNIASGWQKFSDQTKTTGTIISQLSNTMSKEAAEGLTSEYMKKIQFYADMTSYSLTGMTDAVSKFIGKGKDMDTSFKASVGIANWAATAGKNAQEAQIAFNALSKVADHVAARNWTSIELGTMDTIEFKNATLEAAAELGVLTKSAERYDGVVEYLTDKGNIVTAEDFTSHFADEWFNLDVLMKVLGDYGSAIEGVMDVYDEFNGDKTSFEALDIYEDRLKAAADAALAEGNETEYARIQTELFSIKATHAAAEARTLEDAINAVKDAVSTGWLTAFQKIIGEYEEAKEFFSDFSDVLINLFTMPTEAINKALDTWLTLGGRDDLFGKEIKNDEGNITQYQGALWNLADTVKEVVDIIIKAWKEVFDSNVSLKDITKSIKDFTFNVLESLRTHAEDVKNIFKGLFSVLKLGVKIFQGIRTAIDPIIKAIIGDSGNFVKFLGDISEKFANWVSETEIFTKIGSKISTVFTTIIEGLKELKLIERISKAFKELNDKLKIGQALKKVWDSLVKTFNFLFDVLIDGIKAIITFTNDYLVPAFADMIEFFGGFLAVVGKVVFEGFKVIINGIKQFAEAIKNNEAIQNGWKSFIDWLKSIPENLKSLGPFFKKMAENIGKFFSTIWKGIKKFGSSLSTVVTLDKVASFFQFIGEKISLAFNTIAYAISSFASKNFSNVAKGTQKALSPLATLFQGLWDLLKGVWNVIKALIPIIGKMLSAIGNFLTWLGDSLSRTFTKDVNGTGKGINLWYLINGGVIALFLKWLYDFVFLFTGLTSGISDVIYATASMLRGKAIKAWAEAVKEVALAILIIVASLAIIAAIDPSRLDKAVKVLLVLMATMAAVIVIMGKFLKQSSYEMKHSFVGVKNILTGNGMSTTTKGTGYFGISGMIVGFGVAILALVASLKIIDSIDPDRVWDDLVVLGLLIAAYGFAVGLMMKMSSVQNEDGKLVPKALKGVLGFALGVLLLTKSLKIIGEMPFEQSAKGMIIIGLIMYSYSKMAKTINDAQAPAMNKIISLAAGLLLLSASIHILGKMDIGALAKGVSSIIILSAMFGVLIKYLKDIDGSTFKGFSIALISFTACLTVLAFLINGPIKDARPEDIGKFALIVTTITVALLAIMWALSKFFKAKPTKEITNNKNTIKAIAAISAVFLSIAAAALLIGASAHIFASVNWNNAKWGFVMLGVLLAASIGIFIAAKRIKVDDYRGLYTKLAIFAGIVQTLITFAAQIGLVAMIFAQVDWKNAIKGFGVFGLVLAAAVGIFAVLAKVKIDTSSYQNIMGMGVIILALSTMMVAVAILATVAKNVDAETIKKTVALIAVSLLGVVMTAVVASKFKNDIDKTSIALVKLAASFALFGVGAVAFATGLKLLKNNVGMLLMFVGVMALAGIVMKILGSAAPTMLMIAIAFGLIGAAALALGGGFYLIVLAVKELLPVLDELAAKSDSLETVLEAMIAGAIKGIAKAIPTITENLLTALDMLLAYGLQKLIQVKDWFMALDISKVMDVIGKLALFALAALIAVLEKVNEKIGEISRLLTEILIGAIVGAINGIANKMQDITDAIANFVISFIDALGETFVKNAARARDAIIRFAKNIWNAFLTFFGIHSPSKTTEEGGVNIVRGIGKGILKTVKEVVRVVINLGKEILKPLKELPKAFFDIGFSIIQSFLNGLKNTILAVFDFIEDVVNRVKRFFGIGGKKETKEFADAGKDMVIQYKNGLEEGEMEVNSTAKAVINETIDILSTETGIFKEIGRTIVEYIAEGISLNGSLISYELYNVITDLFSQFSEDEEGTMSDLDTILDDYVESAIEGIKTKFEEVKLSEIVNEYLSKILDVLHSELSDEDIVIRPVMDLSDIQNGTGLIAAMLSSVSGVTVASASANAERASSEISSAKQASEASQVSATSQLQTTDAQGGVYNLTFNITGNDPKAIADEVSKRFQQEISRRNLAYK